MTKFKNCLEWVRSIQFNASFYVKFMGFLQLFYTYHFFVTDDVGGLDFSYQTIAIVVASIFTVMVSYMVLMSLVTRQWVMVLVSIIGLNTFTTIVAYHFEAQELLDWAVLVDNVTIAFSFDAAQVMINNLNIDALLYGLVFSLILVVLELFFRTLSKPVYQHFTNRSRWVWLCVYVMILLSPLDSYDPVLNFFRSIKLYYTSYSTFKSSKATLPSVYVPSIAQENIRRPHVLVIQVESLNHAVLGQLADNGKVITPFLNELMDQSVYIDQFYGNSIQTAKGHFATLFSVVPSVTGKAFVRYNDLKLPSIATVFKENGYDTTVFSGFYKRSFDNTEAFLLERGFNQFQVVRDYVSKEELEDKLRWGVRDDVYYKHFLDVFTDKIRSTGQSQFYFLPTISNHFPFNSLKPHHRYIYDETDGLKQDYQNSVHLVDRGLSYFFKELKARGLSKEVLVIVTSDHAFPMGLHQNYHLEAGYHNDSFRIPFFMVWDTVLPPQKIQGAYSQMDILPSLMDLLNLSFSNSTFQGVTIFKEDRRNPIYLIQPYGKHFSIIRHPYKYRLFTKTMTEYVYDLDQDPMETTNIKSTLTTDQLEQFRTDIQQIYANQYHIEQNLFLPIKP